MGAMNAVELGVTNACWCSLWAHGAAAAADADAPCAVASVVICSIVECVKVTALPLPVLLVPAKSRVRRHEQLMLRQMGSALGGGEAAPIVAVPRVAAVRLGLGRHPEGEGGGSDEAVDYKSKQQSNSHGCYSRGHNSAKIAAAVKRFDCGALTVRVAAWIVLLGSIIHLQSVDGVPVVCNLTAPT